VARASQIEGAAAPERAQPEGAAAPEGGPAEGAAAPTVSPTSRAANRRRNENNEESQVSHESASEPGTMEVNDHRTSKK
jgi:hypothetical protein